MAVYILFSKKIFKNFFLIFLNSSYSKFPYHTLKNNIGKTFHNPEIVLRDATVKGSLLTSPVKGTTAKQKRYAGSFSFYKSLILIFILL
jgi:hypothetical protein